MKLRDYLGHFVRVATAAPVAEADAGGDDQAQAKLDPLPADPRAFWAEAAALRAQIAALRERRQDLLVDGDIAAVAAVDVEIRHLEIAGESLEVRRQAAEAAQADAEQNRRAQEWQRLRPQLESAQRHVSRLAFEMFAAVDQLRQVEGAAAALGVAVAHTPEAQWVNGYWLEQRALEHALGNGGNAARHGGVKGE